MPDLYLLLDTEESGKVTDPIGFLERETGFEPATDGLGSRCATTALLPLKEG
jgi:hypothetical protein